MKKRLISLMLALVMVIGICPFTTEAAVSDDYTQWKQYDEAWNQEAAWPEAPYPYMRQAGCLVTSIAMLLRHYHVVTETSTTAFNPWICNEALKAAGAINAAGDLIPYRESWAYPGLVREGWQEYSFENLQSLLNNGYACIVRVDGSNGGEHFVAVHSIEGSTVNIMDPGSHASILTNDRNPTHILYYTVTPAEPPLVKETYPSHCVVKVTGTSYIKTLPCSQKTDSNSANVERATKGDEYRAIGLHRNKAGNLWYQVVTDSGETGYLYAGDTEFKAQSIHDISASGITAPETHTAGQVYVLSGNVSAEYNHLTEISAYIHTGNSEQGPRVTGTSDTVNENFYSLGGSSIDSRTEYNILSAGVYTYTVSASYQSYYAKSATTLGTKTGTIGLYKTVFQVIDGNSSTW